MTSQRPTAVRSLGFALCYAKDLEATEAFYSKHFGFTRKFEMGEGQAFGSIGDVDMWIGGDYSSGSEDPLSTRMSVMFMVDSAGALFSQLHEAEVPIIQDAPVKMADDKFWFQFRDPSGNVVEILGGE